MSGKGSKRRPKQITQEELDRRWKLAFGWVDDMKTRRENKKDKPHHINVEIK